VKRGKLQIFTPVKAVVKAAECLGEKLFCNLYVICYNAVDGALPIDG